MGAGAAAKKAGTGEPGRWEGKQGGGGVTESAFPEGGGVAPPFTYFPAVLEVVLKCGNMEVTGDLGKSESSSP